MIGALNSSRLEFNLLTLQIARYGGQNAPCIGDTADLLTEGGPLSGRDLRFRDSFGLLLSSAKTLLFYSLDEATSCTSLSFSERGRSGSKIVDSTPLRWGQMAIDPPSQ